MLNILGNLSPWLQGRRNGVDDGGTAPCLLRGATGSQVPLNNDIMSNFMIYQDRLETN